MFAGAFFLFLLVIVYAARRSSEKDEEEVKPSVIDARLRAPRIPEATNVAASNLGISVPPPKRDWAEYDVPTVLRRRRTTTS